MEIAKEACRRLGVTPEFKQISWQNKDACLSDGTVDCLCGSFSMNGREESYAWAGPYMYSRQVVVVKATSDIRTLRDLNGKYIAVQNASMPDELFSNDAISGVSVKKVYSFATMSAVFAALKKEYVDACAGHETACLLLELVNDIILMLNKADRKRGDDIPTTAVFRLSEEVRKLYLIAAEQAKGYDGVTLEPPQFSGEDKPLVGESLYLRQIMMNIIANAVRYSKKGGTVCFSLSQNPARNRDGYAEVHFVCEDNGIGMSKEFQKSMFEPFTQENTSSVSRFGGVGLGLSIVQKLVNILNGTMEVDSEQGRGTRFEIKISYPYADVPDTAEPQADGPASLAGLTLLIVEDNELNMEIAEFMVTDVGGKIIKAYDGRQAVEKFAVSAVGEIDVILTDEMLPGMDGLEETRRIRTLDRPDAGTVPVIAMTANPFEEDLREYTDAGVTGVLPKPLNIDQLIETVTKQITKGGKTDG